MCINQIFLWILSSNNLLGASSEATVLIVLVAFVLHHFHLSEFQLYWRICVIDSITCPNFFHQLQGFLSYQDTVSLCLCSGLVSGKMIVIMSLTWPKSAIVYWECSSIFSWDNAHIYLGKCKEEVTPLLMHWSYIFLALTHWYEAWGHFCSVFWHLILHSKGCVAFDPTVNSQGHTHYCSTTNKLGGRFIITKFWNLNSLWPSDVIWQNSTSSTMA